MNRPAVIWLDMQLPVWMCDWCSRRTGIGCSHFSALGLGTSTDVAAFDAARAANAAILTKDWDFVPLVRERGAPPWILWLRVGNCSNAELRALLDQLIDPALELIRSGEPIIELRHRE